MPFTILATSVVMQLGLICFYGQKVIDEVIIIIIIIILSLIGHLVEIMLYFDFLVGIIS